MASRRDGAPYQKDGESSVVDFISRVPVSMLLEEERHRETRDPMLDEKLLHLATTMANQRDTIVMLMENQRRIDQLRATALSADRQALEQMFVDFESKIDEHISQVRRVRQQQDHLLRLMDVAEKVKEQDRCIRKFCEMQRDFMQHMQPSLLMQTEAMRALQSAQASLMQSVGTMDRVPPVQPWRLTPPHLPSTKPPAPADTAAAAAPVALTSTDFRALEVIQCTNVPTTIAGGLQPYPRHRADEDAQILHRAISGFFVNRLKISSMLGSRTRQQRASIAQEYDRLFHRDMVADVLAKTSGAFNRLLAALLEPETLFLARCVNRAIKGLGTDDGALIETLCTRSNVELVELREAYRKEFGRPLELDVSGDTSGCYQRLLVQLVKGQRDADSAADLALAKDDASRLYQAGEGRLGTNEDVFIEVLTRRSFAHLRLVFHCYGKLEDFDIEKSIERETSSDFQKALLVLVKTIKSRWHVFAELLHAAMKGIGTNNNTLIRIIASRSEIDLYDIANVYRELYKTTLEQRLFNDTSGLFRKLLLELFGDRGFDPEKDAKKFRKGMMGYGHNSLVLNKVIGHRIVSQRQAIRAAYDTLYKRDLLVDLKSELSGDYQRLVLALMTPPMLFRAQEIHRAIKGLGTNDSLLIELLCSATGHEMRLIKEAYLREYKRELALDVRGDTSGSYCDLLAALVEHERDDNAPVNAPLAVEQASRLYAAGEGRAGTDEDYFINVMSRHSYAHLKMVFDAYEQSYGRPFERAIVAETSFNFKKALLTMAAVIRSRTEYFAALLHKAMKGPGTRDPDLIRVMVLRSEIDLREINDVFFKLTTTTLEAAIQADTSKAYRDLLLRVLEHARRTPPPPPAPPAPAPTVVSVPDAPPAAAGTAAAGARTAPNPSSHGITITIGAPAARAPASASTAVAASGRAVRRM